MYATFAFVCLWGYRKQLIDSDAAFRKRAILLTILISIAFGGLTEILQEYLVPGRTGDVIDFLADIIGTGLGAFLFHIFLRRKK